MNISRYSGLIKCMKCGKNYKAKKERGKMKYICSSYDRYGKEKCERDMKSEEELNGLIELHFKKELNDTELRNEVKCIEVYHDRKLIITYQDESQTISTKTFLQV